MRSLILQPGGVFVGLSCIGWGCFQLLLCSVQIIIYITLATGQMCDSDFTMYKYLRTGTQCSLDDHDMTTILINSCNLALLVSSL